MNQWALAINISAGVNDNAKVSTDPEDKTIDRVWLANNKRSWNDVKHLYK